ncbi:MAG: helix-turn-helix domain-containing protein [Clostridia bacterium]|nr:helix-turn-helix domain-containing protein [Clostridia bacterium]
MTVMEAAKALRCSKNTVYSLITEGRIQAIRVGRCFKVPKSALVDFMSAEKNYFIISPNNPDCLWTSPSKCGIDITGEKNRSQKGVL